MRLLIHVSQLIRLTMKFWIEAHLSIWSPSNLQDNRSVTTDLFGPLIFEPGTPGRWEYSTGIDWAGQVVERVNPDGLKLDEFIDKHIWQPLGMEYDASWSLDSKRHDTEKAFCCLNARARDFAKFGRLYLHHGQWQGRDLPALFPGNTLVNTDGTLEACLKGAEYYAPGGRLFSLGCNQRANNQPGVDYGIYRLRWYLKGGRFCTTSRMDPKRFVCITNGGQSSAVLSKGGSFPPSPGQLAVQLPGGDNAPLLRGNIFHFRD